MGGVTYTSTASKINSWNIGTKFTFNKVVTSKNDPDPDGDDTPIDLTKKSKNNTPCFTWNHMFHVKHLLEVFLCI